MQELAVIEAYLYFERESQVASQNNQIGLVALQGLKYGYLQSLRGQMGFGAQVVRKNAFSLQVSKMACRLLP